MCISLHPRPSPGDRKNCVTALNGFIGNFYDSIQSKLETIFPIIMQFMKDDDNEVRCETLAFWLDIDCIEAERKDEEC